ncbi:MAG: DUF169 domain-containing protein [Bacillota bacterium]
MSNYKEAAEEIQRCLRLRTYPLGVKLFEKAEDLQKVEKIRTWPQKLSFCQYVTMARTSGWTMGFTVQGLGMPACMFMLGLAPLPEAGLLDGESSVRVWMGEQEDAARYQQSLPRISFGKFNAVALSPMTSGRLEDPDVVLIYGTPGQLHLLMNAWQWKDYQRLEFFFSGEGSCADSLVECYKNKRPYLSIPCYGQRRFGHVQEDELEIAVPPSHLQKIVDGLAALRKAGTATYPIVNYGPMVSPLPVITMVYPKISKYIAAVEKGEFPKKID